MAGYSPATPVFFIVDFFSILFHRGHILRNSHPDISA